MKLLQTTTFFILFVFLTSSVFAQTAKSGDDVIGLWFTENAKSLVKVTKKDNKYYGKIIWLKTPLNEEGKEKVDHKNPDEKLRTQPLKGLTFMLDFSFDKDDEEWIDGKVYDPASGKLYSGILKMPSKDIVELRGYIGISLIGRTSTWIRKKDKK